MLCHGASSMVASMPGMLGSGGRDGRHPGEPISPSLERGTSAYRHGDDLLRVAASVKGGHAIAALVVGKRCSSRRQQNALATAIKE